VSLFKRKPESQQEIAAEARLDEVTREVAADELDKEGERARAGFFGPLTFAVPRFRRVRMRWSFRDPVLIEPVDDPDRTDEEGLRSALHEHDAKE
jgi:hypothetical protein